MSNADALLKKLKDVDRDDCTPELGATVDRLINEVERAEGFRTISGSFVIKELLKDYGERIDRINQVLLTKPGLEKSERDVMLTERSLYTNFVHLFNPDERLKQIEQAIKHHEL
jgi:hypothetical protein